MHTEHAEVDVGSIGSKGSSTSRAVALDAPPACHNHMQLQLCRCGPHWWGHRLAVFMLEEEATCRGPEWLPAETAARLQAT